MKLFIFSDHEPSINQLQGLSKVLVMGIWYAFKVRFLAYNIPKFNVLASYLYNVFYEIPEERQFEWRWNDPF